MSCWLHISWCHSCQIDSWSTSRSIANIKSNWHRLELVDQRKNKDGWYVYWKQYLRTTKLIESVLKQFKKWDSAIWAWEIRWNFWLCSLLDEAKKNGNGRFESGTRRNRFRKKGWPRPRRTTYPRSPMWWLESGPQKRLRESAQHGLMSWIECHLQETVKF